MRLFPALLRKPASDTYLRDYLIGGVVRIEYANMNSNRWFFLAVATLVILAFGIYRFTATGRYAIKNSDGLAVVDTWTGAVTYGSAAQSWHIPFKHR